MRLAQRPLQLIKLEENAETTKMTAGDKPYCETVYLRAPWSGCHLNHGAPM